MVRSFLAFGVSEEVRLNLGALICSLKPLSQGVHWVEPENFHCTLKFFGDLDERFLNDSIVSIIEKEIRNFRSVLVKCIGIQVFPNWKYPKVVWAGLSGNIETVLQWHRLLEEAFAKEGVVRDERDFRTHLTVGRVKQKLKKASWIKTLEKLVSKDFGSMKINGLTLYKSQLTKTGPIYTPLKQFLLPI